MEPVDYSDHVEKEPASDILKQIGDLANQQHELQYEIEKKEEELDQLRKKLKSIAEHDLPELMDEVELKTFQTSSGIKVEIKESIRASIPKKFAVQAFDWLDEHGYSRLIKRKFIILFGKDEEKWANRFEGDLKRRKRQLAVDRKKEVHSQTLSAWAREQLEDGVDIPENIFGVYRQRIAKIQL